jgi:hypothetical protein
VRIIAYDTERGKLVDIEGNLCAPGILAHSKVKIATPGALRRNRRAWLELPHDNKVMRDTRAAERFSSARSKRAGLAEVSGGPSTQFGKKLGAHGHPSLIA